MSKRFGRNQRRRAREQVAALVDENSLLTVKASMQERSLTKAANRLCAVEVQLDNVKRYIGANHPAFEASGYEVQPSDYPDMRLFLPGAGNQPVDAMTFEKSVRHEKREVHYLLTYKGKPYGYAITEQSLRMGNRQVLAAHIGQAFAEVILAEMQGDRQDYARHTRGREYL